MNPSKPVAIIGTGGHAKVILDNFISTKQQVLCFLDDDPRQIGSTIHGIPVQGPVNSVLENLLPQDVDLIVAIGANGIRKKVSYELTQKGYHFARAIHDSAIIGSGVQIGVGTVMMAGSIINIDTKVGVHAIINTGATIDHDCHIGDFCQIAPGVHLCGGVRIGTGTLIGVGAQAIPCMEVGSWSIVGGGSTVIRHIPDNCTATGSPTVIRKKAE